MKDRLSVNSCYINKEIPATPEEIDARMRDQDCRAVDVIGTRDDSSGWSRYRSHRGLPTVKRG